MFFFVSIFFMECCYSLKYTQNDREQMLPFSSIHFKSINGKNCVGMYSIEHGESTAGPQVAQTFTKSLLG